MNLRASAVLICAGVFSALASAAPLIYLDPGHTLEAPGVIGSCGTKEVWVNDQLVIRLADLLKSAGYNVAFSRTPNVDMNAISLTPGREPKEGLQGRGMGANRSKADLFISIHHDSMKEDLLVEDKGACGENASGDRRVVVPEFLQKFKVGFNVFMHPAPGKKFKRSLSLAKLIGKGFVDHEQIPANFHVKEVEPDCGSCVLQDAATGVISRNLAVIRTPMMPALLIEVTNLRIAEMEKKANDPAFQQLIAEIIKQGIDQYFAKGLNK